MAEFVGKRVVLELTEGASLSGYVHSIDATTSKLTLQKVTTSDGKRLPGLKHFFDYELETINVLEEQLKKPVDDNKKRDQDRCEKGKKLMKNKEIPQHLKRLREFQQANIELRQLNHSDEEQQSPEKPANKTSEYDSSSDPEQLDDVDAPYVLIRKIDQRFTDAVQYISQQLIVGFAVEGVCVGREGRLCWLQFGTKEHVFIFDIIALGPRCFEEGIKGILEDPEVQKVMHDCRLVSDMLHHQYDTGLVNVFDTQVADAFVYRLHHHNDWPRYVQGLAHCLIDHLDLEPEQVHAMKVRDAFQEEDQEVWAKRPASRDILMAAMKNVMYLKGLRNVLEEKMMAEFVAGVDIYLAHVKNASKLDAKKAQTASHKIPLAFQELPAMMSHRDHSRFYRRRDHTPSDKEGFRDNVARINDTNVSYSRDSPWHLGQEGRKNYNKIVSLIGNKGKTDTTSSTKENTEQTNDTKALNNLPTSTLPTCTSGDHSVTVTTSGAATANKPTSGVQMVSEEYKHMKQNTPRQYLSDENSSDETLRTEFCDDKEVSFTSMKMKPFKPLPDLKEVMSNMNGVRNFSVSESKGKDTGKGESDAEFDENTPLGQLIRSALKQRDEALPSSDLDSFKLCPAGKLITDLRINDKTSRRRQKEMEAAVMATDFSQSEASEFSSSERPPAIQERILCGRNEMIDDFPEYFDDQAVERFNMSPQAVESFDTTPQPSSTRCLYRGNFSPSMSPVSSPEKSLSPKPSAQSIKGLSAISRMLGTSTKSPPEGGCERLGHAPSTEPKISNNIHTSGSSAGTRSRTSSCSSQFSSVTSPYQEIVHGGGISPRLYPIHPTPPNKSLSPRSPQSSSLSDVEVVALNRAMKHVPNRMEQLKLLVSATKKDV